MNTSEIMEQTKYWMWARRKFNSPISAISTSSWEEQAFAEDSAGLLGGCIWPPRSYTCSFCRREFRSAQALGGHMNVHRRDRARLKQSSSPSDETLYQVSTLDQFYTPNPNPNFAIIGSSLPTASALELHLGVGNWKGKRGWEKDDDVNDDDEFMCNNKRRRIDRAVFPTIIKPPLEELKVIRSEVVLKLCPSHDEEIDLELRLGDPPKHRPGI